MYFVLRKFFRRDLKIVLIIYCFGIANTQAITGNSIINTDTTFFELENMESDSLLVRKQFLEFFTVENPKDELVGKYFIDMLEDGTWEYVDYKSKRRGGWPTTKHLLYLDEMALAYIHPKSRFYKDLILKKSILNGLRHWLNSNYRNSNWFPMDITIPKHIARIFMFLGNEVPKDIKEQAWDKVFKRIDIHRTGSNKVLESGIAVMKGYIYNKTELIKKAADSLWSEVKLSKNEGIQADWCFHQHGHQQQLGNYGNAFGETMVRWAFILRNTEYALPSKKISIIRNFLINGPAWFLWKGKMELNACGRQYKPQNQEHKYESFIRQFNWLKQIDLENKTTYQDIVEHPEKLIGHNSYWKSDFAVHREKNWMASVKMSSSRVQGTEEVNRENISGTHMGDGRLLVGVNGDEYSKIAPLWDWHRLPGTTCDQGLQNLHPPHYDKLMFSNFAGVLGNGKIGVAAMHYKRNYLKAKKTWFFIDNSIVCVGSGIMGDSRKEVLTSVEQSNLKGDIQIEDGVLSKREVRMKPNSWIHHNNIGYYLFSKSDVKKDYVKSNWQSCFPSYDSIPAEGSIFNISINHGRNPISSSYAYIIFPDTHHSEMFGKTKNIKTKILDKTEALHAIQNDLTIMAVFFEPGKLITMNKKVVKVDKPCLLMLSEEEIRVSDPIHKSISVEIQIGDKVYNIPFPQDKEKGNQVTLKRI